MVLECACALSGTVLTALNTAWADDDWLVVGGGSNLLVADAGFDGTVVLVRTRGVEEVPPDVPGADGVTVRVAAGEPWDAFVASTGVIVPVQTEYLSLRGLAQLENTLAMVRENLNPAVAIIGIVPTMYDRRLTHSREADEILRENFGDLVYNTRIRKTIRFAEAPVKGSSVLGYEPDGAAAEMYRDLAKEVLDGKKSRKHA